MNQRINFIQPKYSCGELQGMTVVYVQDYYYHLFYVICFYKHVFYLLPTQLRHGNIRWLLDGRLLYAGGLRVSSLLQHPRPFWVPGRRGHVRYGGRCWRLLDGRLLHGGGLSSILIKILISQFDLRDPSAPPCAILLFLLSAPPLTSREKKNSLLTSSFDRAFLCIPPTTTHPNSHSIWSEQSQDANSEVSVHNNFSTAMRIKTHLDNVH